MATNSTRKAFKTSKTTRAFMATKATIYHNPRCSKSRQTLALLGEHGIETEVIDYLKTPPTREELESLLEKLGFKPGDLIRNSEPLFKELGLDDATAAGPGNDASAESIDERLLAAMIEHPILIQRPIVVIGDKAVLGRPPENIELIL